jgi:hypothetical protein
VHHVKQEFRGYNDGVVHGTDSNSFNVCL